LEGKKYNNKLLDVAGFYGTIWIMRMNLITERIIERIFIKTRIYVPGTRRENLI
jgi:hypothetical protein